MNLIGIAIRYIDTYSYTDSYIGINSSQRGASVSRHRMSTQDETLMTGKKSDNKLNTARKTRKYVLY